MHKPTFSRRAFLAATTTVAAAMPLRVNAAKVIPRKLSPNEKLNVASIGCGGKGTGDIMSCAKENVVALCDVDWERAGEAFYRLPKAKQFYDYRKMLDEMPEIDALTISTPDHTHAPAAYRAMSMGKHVYVQKPLTHTVAEARLLTQLGRKTGVATQMGNQGQSGNGVRDTCEMLWAGAIGAVRESHTWTDRPGMIWPQGINKVLAEKPVRDKLDWDLWLGCAAYRPYNIGYCPRRWRGWWDFGCGALGDMGCHNMNPSWAALKLGEAWNFSVECLEAEGLNEHTGPVSSVIQYDFPARGDQAPVAVYWYDGGKKPQRPEGAPEAEAIAARDNATLFVGDEGVLICGVHGEDPTLLPEEKMADFPRPARSLARVQDENHYQNWIEACKGGPAASSNFDYSGPLTEFVNFGNIAVRSGKKLDWDRRQMKITNDEDANRYLTKTYRKGWELPL